MNNHSLTLINQYRYFTSINQTLEKAISF